MPFRLRQIPQDSKISQQGLLHVFEDLYPLESICEVLTETHAWEKRERKLGMLLVVCMLIAQSLFPRLDKLGVIRELVAGARLLFEDFDLSQLPSPSALPYRQQQLGSVPLRRLLRRFCRPLAGPQTKGAFALGYRLMAIDGTLEDVADTKANALHFGRLTEGNSRSPFPLLRCLYLVECGTHAIVDAVLAPVRKSEQAMVRGLLRSIQSQMLVLLDRGFFAGWLLEALQARGAHSLVRVPSGALGSPLRYLSDGSYLAQLLPGHSADLQAPLTLRVITYRLKDPSLPQAERLIRLATTLLDPKQAPAATLMQLYHERWEIELVIDEIKNHQCLAGHTLRSKTPEGVYQEMYALLLAHYALRALMLQAAEQADLDPERISFSLTVELVGRAVRDFVQAAPCEHARLKAQLLRELAQAPLPARTLRLQERVVKRRFSKWKRKRDSQFFSYHERARAQPALCQVKWLALL